MYSPTPQKASARPMKKNRLLARRRESRVRMKTPTATSKIAAI